jgi:transcription elongation factor Elf1
MSTVPLATAFQPSLADAVDESLAAALAGREMTCLWCGGDDIEVLTADIWSGAVVNRCRHCGTVLEGVVPRHLREVSR